MSINVNGSSSVSYNFNTTVNTAANTVTPSPTPTMTTDSVSLSSTASQSSPFPEKAGGWAKFKDSVGEFFSDIADKMRFGDTFKLARQEFHQVDLNRNQSLDRGEFNIATMNFLDFYGTEFARADKNRDNMVSVNEYADYRKEQLENIFRTRDMNGDKHLNTNEIGFIGRQLLLNRDVRIDPNQDGMVNKREFVRGALQGMLNIREFLGF